MKNNHMKFVAVNIVLMMALMVAIIGVSSQQASANGSSDKVPVRDKDDLSEDKPCGEQDDDSRDKQFEQLETVANHIGVDVRTLWSELEAGQSIAEVAQANGMDPQTIIDALIAAAQIEIDEAVATEKISNEEAAEWSAKLEERLTYYVNDNTAVFAKDDERGEKWDGDLREREAIAGLIGVDASTLIDELKAGQTIAVIAEANGIDPQLVIDTLVTETQAEIDGKVANGDVSAEEVAEWSEKIEERVTMFVNGTFEK